MSVFRYPTYKIRIAPDSQKTQGLQAGDIIRRQYAERERTVYSLMCVTETGTELVGDKDAPYFIGALLDGDEPQGGELLDFVRITNLFDTARSGALYLTASDSDSPYMDVIDGMATERSLCYPVMDGGMAGVPDKSRYAVYGSMLQTEYLDADSEATRIVRFAKIAFVTNIAQFGIFENYVKESVRNQNIIQSVGKYAEEIREYGNQFYLLRETIAVFGVLAVIYILYKKIGKEFWEQNVKFWGFCILLLSFANFGYVSLTFYDRFFKLAVLFLYVFTYMWVMDIQSKLSFKSQLLITMVTIIPVLYFIVTPLVEQRHMLFQLNLWFSNLCS